MKLLINFFREKAKNESDFIDELYSLINHTDSNNQSLLDYVYNILDDFEYKRFKRGNILKDISLMIKNFNAYNFYTRLKNKSHEFVINMVEHILENTPEIGIYNTIKNSSGKYHDEIIFLIMDVAANFINEAETIRIIGNFLYNHEDIKKIIKLFKEIMMIPHVQEIIKEYFNFKNMVINATLTTLFKGGEECDLLFDLFSEKKLIKGGIDIIINIIRRNGSYIETNLPIYLRNIYKVNNTYLFRAVKSYMHIWKYLIG